MLQFNIREARNQYHDINFPISVLIPPKLITISDSNKH